MDTVAKKAELLAILTENRGKHRGVFEAALAGYQAKAIELVEAELAALREGRTPEIRINLTRPRDHTRDYDRAIRQLGLDTRDEITLTEGEVAQLVMDDWRWTREWLRTSSSYAAGATREAYGMIEEDDF